MHRAHAQVVGLGSGAGELIGRVRRQPDQHVLAHESADERWRQVALPHVDAIGAAGERNVGAVVDEEQRLVSFGRLAKRLSAAQQVPGLGILLPQLDHVRAGIKDLIQESGQVALLPAGVRHDVQPGRAQPLPAPLSQRRGRRGSR